MADLTIGTPRNPRSAFQSPDAPSATDASAQWSAVVTNQKAAADGVRPSQTAAPDQTGDQKPAAGSTWLPWIHCGLAAGSFLPSFIGAGFSAADGIVYSIEGDRTNAALSFGAAGVGVLTDAGVAKAAALGIGVAAKTLKGGVTAVKVEKEANGLAKVGEAVVKADRETNAATKGEEAAARRTATPSNAPNNPYNISTVGMTVAERDAAIDYARRSNAWLDKNGPVTVRSTAGSLRSQANEAARVERLRAARAGTPYHGQAGHVPDTALTGKPTPPGGWRDMPGRSNSVAGGGLSSRIGKRIDVITIDGKVP